MSYFDEIDGQPSNLGDFSFQTQNTNQYIWKKSLL